MTRLLALWVRQAILGPRIVVNMANGQSFTLQLDGKATPRTTTRIVSLARSGFYDRQRVHRVVPNFVIQWGDPASRGGVDAPGIGNGGTGKTLPFEPGTLSFTRGTLGMASTGAGVGGDGQMFVVTGDAATFLDGRYTAFGRVVSGMNVVLAVGRGDRILSMVVVR